MAKRLTHIKSSAFTRGLALARVSLAAGTRLASHAVGGLFASSEEAPERLKSLLVSQVNLLSRELGELKGSLMKVGQMLSMYGEHFLPPEANALLKSLQSESPPLEWDAIRKVLTRQLGEEKLACLEIDPEPIASASLGQVHRVRRKSDGAWLAIKVQYPGVDGAIESDLRAIRSVLSISKLVPKGPKYDELFREVQAMLHQEVDYTRELEAMNRFRALLRDDPRFVISEPIPELCTRRVLTMTLEEGLRVDSPEVAALPSERRNAIAMAALELYFREVYRYGMVQTDPHFGNYRIRIGANAAEDRLVLFDFGAVRKFPRTFLEPYLEIVRGAFGRDPERLLRGASDLGFILPEDSEDRRTSFVELCYLITEPFCVSDAKGVYDWGRSDLPSRVARKAAQLAIDFRLRPPPREVVFLDRKMGGVFVFLSVLGARIRARELLESYVKIDEKGSVP